MTVLTMIRSGLRTRCESRRNRSLSDVYSPNVGRTSTDVKPDYPPYATSALPGISFNCVAPLTPPTHPILSAAKSSVSGFAASNALTSSITPALMIFASPNVSPWRKSVLPQSPQKWEVICFPLSAFLEMVLGVPETSLNWSPGMMTLVL